MTAWLLEPRSVLSNLQLCFPSKLPELVFVAQD